MQYATVPSNMPKTPLATPVRMASHIVARVGRPSRFRSRTFMVVLAVIGTICVFLGHRNNLEIERLRTYIPTGITDIIASYASTEFQDTRWDDDARHIKKIAYKKPKFHLLIPASNHSVNLCKTLLSAAILNYPPPTLVSYGVAGVNQMSGLKLVNTTYNFLRSKEARDDDLVLVVEEDAWFQLPPEVTINRFFLGMQDATTVLSKRYGQLQVPMSSENETVPLRTLPKFTSKVLFGAAKGCSNPSADPACFSVPQSPLPKDIYGLETDKSPDGKYDRPKFMGSTMVMGRVSDLRPIYKRATEMLASGRNAQFNSQQVFSRIFGEQEYARSLASPPAPLSRSAKFRNLFMGKQEVLTPTNWTLSPRKNYEYGITLDYSSSIFQTMNNSFEDIQMVSFNHPSVIASPSKISANSFVNPINLPLDLNSTSPPFSQHVVSSTNPMPPMTALDVMSGAENQNSWSEIDLATNVIVPGSSVPASLNFHGNEPAPEEMWRKMWYHKYARALMRQYMRSPDGPIAAQAARAGGDQWWDLRGGKGGVWTDRGEWLEWNEVCGTYDNEVFGDEKGEFGYEDEALGGQKVEYKFGQIVSGRVGKGKHNQTEGADGENGGKAKEEGDEAKDGEDAEAEKEEELSEEQKVAKAAEKFKAELDGEDEEEDANDETEDPAEEEPSEEEPTEEEPEEEEPTEEEPKEEEPSEDEKVLSESKDGDGDAETKVAAQFDEGDV